MRASLVLSLVGVFAGLLTFNIPFAELAFQYNTESSQWWQSMAVAIIFGLLFSTLLTLGVVPTLYIIYSRYKLWLYRTFNWKVDTELEGIGVDFTGR